METRPLNKHPLGTWLGIGFGSISLLCLSPSFFWVGELACGFRWHLGWLGLLALVPLLARKHWVLAALFALVSVWHIYPETALYFGPVEESDELRPELELASVNLRWNNEEHDQALAWIREEKPDVLALLELTQPWLPLLEGLRELYPHQLLAASDEVWEENTWGVALLSQLPFESTRALPLPSRDLPLLEAVVVYSGHSLTVRAVHVMCPGGPKRIAERNSQLQTLMELEWDTRAVLLGDLNATTYTPLFRELCERSGLRDSRAGFGRQESFHVGEYLGWRLLFPLGLAIDHVLVGPDILVHERSRGPYIGSDHVPVVCRIGVAEL